MRSSLGHLPGAHRAGRRDASSSSSRSSCSSSSSSRCDRSRASTPTRCGTRRSAQHEVFSTSSRPRSGCSSRSGSSSSSRCGRTCCCATGSGPPSCSSTPPRTSSSGGSRARSAPTRGASTPLAVRPRPHRGVDAVGHWQKYLLFAHSSPSASRDPLFGKDVGFYIFRLPFLTFVVDWLLASLVAIIVFTRRLPLPERRHPRGAGDARG